MVAVAVVTGGETLVAHGKHALTVAAVQIATDA